MNKCKTFKKQIDDNLGEEFMKFILNNSNKPLDWCWISRNPNITMDIIKNNPDKPWNWDGVSLNPNLTMEFVKYIDNNPYKRLGWYGISQNSNITMDDIITNPYLPWE